MIPQLMDKQSVDKNEEDKVIINETLGKIKHNNPSLLWLKIEEVPINEFKSTGYNL